MYVFVHFIEKWELHSSFLPYRRPCARAYIYHIIVDIADFTLTHSYTHIQNYTTYINKARINRT